MRNQRRNAERGNFKRPLAPLWGFISSMTKGNSQEDTVSIDRLTGELTRLDSTSRNETKVALAKNIDSILSNPNTQSVQRLAYIINYPVLDNICFKSLAMAIARDIKLNDAGDDRNMWHVKHYDLWKMFSKYLDLNHKWYPEMFASGLVEALRLYIDDTHKLLAVLVQCIAWLLATGSDTAPRILNALKVSWRNTVSAAINDIPMLQGSIDYLCDQMKILGGVDERGVVSIALPIYNDFSSAYVLKPDVELFGFEGWEYDENDPKISDIVGKILNKPPIIGNFAQGGINDVYFDIINNSPFKYAGAIAATMRHNVENVISLFKQRWSGFFLLASDPLLRFFVEEYPMIDSNLKLLNLQNKIANQPVYDIENFVAKNMRYSALPGPRMRLDAPNKPTLMPADIRKGEVVNFSLGVFADHAYSYEEIHTNLIESSGHWINCLHVEADAAFTAEGIDPVDNLGPRFSFTLDYTIRPDQQADMDFVDECRDYPKYYSTRLMYDDFVQLYDGMESNDYYFAEKKTDYDAMHPTWQISYPHVVDMTAFDAHDTLNTNVPAGPAGYDALRRDVYNCFVSHAVYDTSGDNYLDVLKKSVNENGAFMIPSALNHYCFHPRRLVSPTINNNDPAQCGFYLLTAHEDLLRNYPTNYDNWYAVARDIFRDFVTNSALAPGGSGSSIWGAEDSVTKGLTNAQSIKDTLIFIGDGFLLHPRNAMDRDYATSSWVCGSVMRYLSQFPISIFSKSRISDGLQLSPSDTLKQVVLEPDGSLVPNYPDPLLLDPVDDTDYLRNVHSDIQARKRLYPQNCKTSTHPTLFEVRHPEAIFIENFRNVIDQCDSFKRFMAYAISTGITACNELPKSSYNSISLVRAFRSTSISPMNSSAISFSSKSTLLNMFDKEKSPGQRPMKGKSFKNSKDKPWDKKTKIWDKTKPNKTTTKRPWKDKSKINPEDASFAVDKEVDDGKLPAPKDATKLKKEPNSLHDGNFKDIEEKTGTAGNAKDV
jgi:hypothetical protein